MSRAVRVGGYTFVELLSVIVIMGVLAVAALPRFADVNVFASRGFYEESLSAVRYAHQLAVASGCSINVSFSAASDTYTISRWTGGTDCNQRTAPLTAVQRPGGGGGFSAVAPKDVNVGNNLQFFYDRIGRPRDTAGALITAANLLRVDIDGRRLQVVPETGLVAGE